MRQTPIICPNTVDKAANKKGVESVTIRSYEWGEVLCVCAVGRTLSLFVVLTVKTCHIVKLSCVRVGHRTTQ